MFSMEYTTVRITAAHMTSAVTTTVERVGDRNFIRLAKADRKISRLLVMNSGKLDNPDKEDHDKHESRPLSKTSIIETLTELRDIEFSKTVPEYGVKGGPRRYDRRSVKCSLMSLAETATIQAPCVGLTPSMAMVVKLDKANERTVAVELVSANLEYLCNVIAHQRETATGKKDAVQHIANDVDVKVEYVSRVNKGKHEGKVRAIHKTDEGKKITKYFKMDTSSCMLGVMDAARSFVAEGAACTGGGDVMGEGGAVSDDGASDDVRE